jgi:hypothetical protein
MNFVGLLHAGPTLIVEADDDIKSHHLPGILKGEHVWCQGFSEPGAGSDLASLSCRAVRDGDHYVISGQKIWTSFAHVADYCEMLVRTDTDVPKHRGITWLIMPMDLPGIDVRPLRTMEGSTEFCEMFLDEVRVPVSNRVGDENDGWRVAMTTLSFERGTAFVSEMLQTMELCHDLAELARTITSGNATAWDDVGSGATSAGSPPSSTPCGHSPSETSPRPPESVWSVPAATSSSWPTPTCATGSATWRSTCSSAHRCRSTTSANSPPAVTCRAVSTGSP